MSSESILNRIDSMLSKKKKEEPIEKPNDTTHPEYSELINVTSKTIKEQSSQIAELKTAILTNSKNQLDNIKELSRIIKDVSLPLTSTKIIKVSDVKARNIYTIIKKAGTGKIREVIISTRNNFYLYIKADNTELFNMYSFEDLSEISELSNNISTREKNEIKTLAIKDISFNKSIEISITSDSIININKVYCIYDIRINT